nr:PREDICTED: mRNA-capping enzyme [Bemisia tabaci]
MSNSDRYPGPIPKRWLKCPRKAGDVIAGKFLAFKTPLDSRYDDQVPEEYRFPPQMLFTIMKSYKIQLGMWFDLTNTDRFYNSAEVEQNDCRYLKIQCQGHGATPTLQQTRVFLDIAESYISKFPLAKIGVHCTHGFNRTGFLICSFLVEKMDWSIGAALTAFAQARPPGIYKGDYIRELYNRYDDVADAPLPPELPSWHTEEEDDSISFQGNNSGRREENNYRRKEKNKKDPEFMEGVGGVTPITEQPLLNKIQRRIQELCEWKHSGFPGCQPVSMDLKNIEKLHEKPYKVSWKADGTRYMMLIDGPDHIFFADRDNSIFQVHGVQFFHRKEPDRHLSSTLLDGEMVIDKVGGQSIPRYLIYDIIRYDNEKVGQTPFSLRLFCIEKEIIGPYIKAKEEGRIKVENEPFRMRAKAFFDLHDTASLLGSKFQSQLSHEPDGLIFQPKRDPYVCGQCKEVLKWKPDSHNSIDFRLKIELVNQPGMLPEKVGKLYVGKDVLFDTMKVSKAMRDLNNKIIECKYDKTRNTWVFMRERTDKSFPNSFNTAIAVAASIKDPVTKEFLINFVEQRRWMCDDPLKLSSSKEDAEMMPPPKMRRLN